MINWPSKCALVAVVMQCIGCAADATDTDSPGERATQRRAIAAAPGETLARLSGSVSPSTVSDRPTRAFGAETAYPKASSQLATESEFIDRGGISSEHADLILESRELFSDALQRMSEDERKSTDAQDLAKLYRNALERAVGAQGIVQNLACGMSLCMGSVSSQSRADRDAWAERLHEDADAARHVTFDVFEVNGDRIQNRFLFSADPSINAIVLPPRRDK